MDSTRHRLQASSLALLLCAMLGCSQTTELLSPSPSAASQTSSAPPSAVTAQAGPPPLGVSECQDQPVDFITDLDIRQTPDMPEPGPRIPFRDPVFGTCLVRVTDRFNDPSQDDPSLGLKNEYARVQSFNADGSRLIIRGTEATWYLYDASSLQRLAELSLDVEPRWDPLDPHRLTFSEGARLMTVDTQSGESSLLHDFASDFPEQDLAAVWTRYEGGPSDDGRYWAFMVQDTDWRTIALIIYDLVEDSLTARLDLSGHPEIDSVTISPLGTYLLAFFEYCQPGQMGDMEQPCGLMVYDNNLERGRGLLRIIGHADTALDNQGRERLVFQDIDRDTIAMLDLETGTVTPLVPIDFSYSPIGFHFSGRASDSPGWVLVSTYSGGHPEDFTWMDDAVFALELKEQGQIIRLAHTHSLVDEDQEHDYWAEPHASVSRDFSRVLFTSNWGRSGTGEVDTYMIYLPQNWPVTSKRMEKRSFSERPSPLGPPS